MRKLLVLIFCLFAWQGVSAAWVFQGIQDGVGIFVDLASFATSGKFRRIQVMQNYPSPTINGAMSLVMQLEIDCQEERVRLLSMQSYSGQTHTGDMAPVVSKPLPWERIQRGSIHQAAQNKVCMKPMERGQRVYTARF